MGYGVTSVPRVCFFCNYGGVYCCEVGVYVLFINGGWVCADVCCVSSVVDYCMFL